MPTVIQLLIAELEWDLKHAVVAEVVFWYCFRSKAASQCRELVCSLQEKKSWLQ